MQHYCIAPEELMFASRLNDLTSATTPFSSFNSICDSCDLPALCLI